MVPQQLRPCSSCSQFRPHLHFKPRLRPRAPHFRRISRRPAVVISGYVALILRAGVQRGRRLQEDGAAEIGVEAVVFGREAAVVETERLRGGQGEERGGLGGAVGEGELAGWGEGGGEAGEGGGGG